MKLTGMERLDKIFSEYVRLRDADYNGYIRCYCCGYPIHWTNAQAMHFMNRRHLGTRFNEENVKAGCIPCNMYQNGNLKAYEEHLIKEYGENIIDKLTVLKNAVTKFSPYEIEKMIEHYRNEVKRLKKEKGL